MPGFPEILYSDCFPPLTFPRVSLAKLHESSSLEPLPLQLHTPQPTRAILAPPHSDMNPTHPLHPTLPAEDLLFLIVHLLKARYIYISYIICHPLSQLSLFLIHII